VQRRLSAKTGLFGTGTRPTPLCSAALPLTPPEDGGDATGNEFVLGLSDATDPSLGILARGEQAECDAAP